MSPGFRPSVVTRRRAVATLGAACAGWAAAPASAAEPRWVDQRRLGPFVCRSTFPLDDRLLALTDLPGLERELRRVLALRPCKREIEVLLVGDAESHRRLVRRRLPGAPYRRALYYQSGDRAAIYAYRHRQLPIDLRHEATHALLHADLPMVPLWLDEGIAEYFEPPRARRAVGPGHLGVVERDARAGRYRPLAQLERKHRIEQLSEADYRYAWAWTHFLLHGPPEATEQLWSFLADVRRGEPPGSMADRLDEAVSPVGREFVSHFRGWSGVLRAASRRR